MHAFVTGAGGFVGPWLIDHLASAGDKVTAAGGELDVTDRHALGDALHTASPTVVYHLAAYSNVGGSWSDPGAAFHANTVGTWVLLDAVRSLPRPPTVVLVGSAEVYGAVKPADLPVTEDHPLRPVSPYAASKAAAEMFGMQAALGFGLPVIRVRPFNHIGPGQSDDFVVSALARRIVRAKKAGQKSIPVGNLSARRDFTDVRDVVRAYRLLAVSGEAGEVYNICSGTSVDIASVAAELLRVAGADVVLERDEVLFRPVDLPELRGDPSRLRQQTGWEPSFVLARSLKDILAYWRENEG